MRPPESRGARTVPDGVRIEILRDPGRLAALAPAWRALEAAAGASVFQSHGWISAWWHGGAAGAGFRLHLALAWDGGALLGVLPLVIRRHHGIRVLEWAAKDCTDYCDVLLAPGRQHLVAPLWQAARRGGGFDIAYLSHLHPDGVLAREGGARLGLRPSRRSVASSSLALGAWRDGAAFQRSLGTGEQKNCRRRRRVLEREGPVRFREVRGAERAPVLEALWRMKREGMRDAGAASPLFGDDGAMLRSLAAALEARGCLRLFALEAGDRLVAVTLSIEEGRRLLDFACAYDRAFHRGSPGILCLVDEVCWAIEHGYAEVDFLCGDEAYKNRFASAHRRLGAMVHARTPLGLAAAMLDSCGPLLARLRARAAAPFRSATSLPGALKA